MFLKIGKENINNNSVRIFTMQFDNARNNVDFNAPDYEAVFKISEADIGIKKIILTRKTKKGLDLEENGELIWIPQYIFQRMQKEARRILLPQENDDPPLSQNIQLLFSFLSPMLISQQELSF